VGERGRCRGECGLDGGQEFACRSGGELNRDPCGRSEGGVSEVNVEGVFGHGMDGVVEIDGGVGDIEPGSVGSFGAAADLGALVA
jgi:hypothetical protein